MFQRTQEWREYRNSLAIQAESGVAIGVPIPTRASPGTDSSDRSTPGTSVEEASSTDGIFYRRTQLPVHAVDVTLSSVTLKLSSLKTSMNRELVSIQLLALACRR